uniref:AGO904 n=1 Tax=Arundo donax TaxID=35708 RepID=A0A0A9AKX9_ARUDO
MAFNPNPIVDVRSAAPNHIENALRDVHRRATQLTKQGMGNQLQLLVVILPEVSGSYGKIRRFCETDIGIVSQCCLPKYARKPNRQYLENVAFKINIKVGGCNTVLEQAFVRNSIPFVPEVPTAIFGADVTHTPPVSVPPCVLPPPQVPAQPHGEQITEESITLSEDSLMGHIVNDMIRDAASEGLSSHVLLHEIDAIRMGGPLSETITIEVVMLNVLVPIQIEKPATLDKVVHEAMRVLNVHLTDVYYTCEGKPVPKGCLLGQPCKLLTCHRLRGGVRNAAVKLRKLIARQMRDNLGKWFERIDIPNDLRTKPNITYTVGLGENAQWVLSMLSDSLENTHADGLSFDGSFDLDDIWYIPDTRSIEIRGRSTTRLTQQGYVLDEGVVMTVMDTFFVYQESDGSVQYPMYIQDLVMRIENLDNAGDEYESTIKRSMIFLHAATRSGCDRVKTFDTLMVHYHKLRPADASAFRVALGEGLNPLRWTAAIRASPQMNKVLTHTIWDNVNRVYRMKFYPENHFGRLDFTRCLITHAHKATEKQIDAAVFVIWETQISDLQYRLLIRYRPPSQNSATVALTSSSGGVGTHASGGVGTSSSGGVGTSASSGVGTSRSGGVGTSASAGRSGRIHISQISVKSNIDIHEIFGFRRKPLN